MKMKIIALAIAGVMASGCSTIVNGSNQGVEFVTADASGVAVEGAQCLATGGSEFSLSERFVTPSEVQIPRSKKPIEITCEQGDMVGSRTIRGKIEGTTGGNLILGGPLGVGIDAATGAIYKYPETVLITLEKAGMAAEKMMGKMDGAVSTDEPIAK